MLVQGENQRADTWNLLQMAHVSQGIFCSLHVTSNAVLGRELFWKFWWEPSESVTKEKMSTFAYCFLSWFVVSITYSSWGMHGFLAAKYVDVRVSWKRLTRKNFQNSPWHDKTLTAKKSHKIFLSKETGSLGGFKSLQVGIHIAWALNKISGYVEGYNF